MQPKTSKRLDKNAFNRIKKTAQNMAVSDRMVSQKGSFATQVPQEIGLQLTNKCNLRCTHCFEWNNEGYNHGLTQADQKGELDYEIIENVLKETQQVKANLFLWGGEPMVYSQWDRLCSDLKKDKRWTVLCTNGILVEEKMDSLIDISKDLAILTSLEGFEQENDLIRGQGSYKRAMGGIQEVIRLQKKNIFKGLQSVHLTISDNMIGKLYEFVEFSEALGIDSLYLCFPWYIPKEVSYDMDAYFTKHFSWLQKSQDKIASWHSFKFKVDEQMIEALLKDLKRIINRTWKIRVRFQPALEINEIPDYIRGNKIAAQNKGKCLAVCNRMDILADGSVSACKLFSEFSVGNLKDKTLEEIWHGEHFNKVRQHLSKELMPVCSKCILLYLNGK